MHVRLKGRCSHTVKISWTISVSKTHNPTEPYRNPSIHRLLLIHFSTVQCWSLEPSCYKVRSRIHPGQVDLLYPEKENHWHSHLNLGLIRNHLLNYHAILWTSGGVSGEKPSSMGRRAKLHTKAPAGSSARTLLLWADSINPCTAVLY